MQARKIIKMPDGNAFIEIGENYIRMGVGDQTFFVLDEKSISAGGEQMNYQMSPNKITYQSILANVGPIPGLIPGGKSYKLNTSLVKGLINIARVLSSTRSAVGI